MHRQSKKIVKLQYVLHMHVPYVQGTDNICIMSADHSNAPP